jgi:hypothetical protein
MALLTELGFIFVSLLQLCRAYGAGNGVANFVDIIWYCENTVGGSLTWDEGSAERGVRKAKFHIFCGGGGYSFKRTMVGRRGARGAARPTHGWDAASVLSVSSCEVDYSG